jgi:hypothetical protein
VVFDGKDCRRNREWRVGRLRKWNGKISMLALAAAM